MLEQKDLEAIQKIMDASINKALAKSEGLILDEIDRTQKNLEKQIHQV